MSLCFCLAEKPMIELSVYQSKTAQSNIVQFKYFKLLIQEFAVKIDQGLIVAILAFLRPPNVRFPFRLSSLISFFVEYSSTNSKYGYRFRTNSKTARCYY